MVSIPKFIKTFYGLEQKVYYVVALVNGYPAAKI